jgi:hypothetical protein
VLVQIKILKTKKGHNVMAFIKSKKEEQLAKEPIVMINFI